ncbi:MAG: dCTP deaminase [Rhizomicrobium sp.]
MRIAISRRLIEIDPAPDAETAFSSTAVDLTLDSRIRIFKDADPGVLRIIDPTQAGFDANETIRALTESRKIGAHGFDLPPKVLILAWTAEYVGLATETRIAARVEGKSSLARLGLGVHVTAPTIHAGFKGQIQLEMVNHGSVPVRLKSGMRICQLIFETTLGTPEKGYRGQFAGQTAKVSKKRAA